MKKLLQLIAVVLTVFVVYSLNAEPVKRVLFEQHTGAWCGWCVDGSYKLEQIMEEFPDRVIPVKWHNGDAMFIPLQTELAKGLGLPGYPAGCIDRKQFNGSYFPARYSGEYSNNAWIPLIQQQLSNPPLVDVQMVYSIDPQTRKFKATITATMLQTVNSNLSFNLYIVEDSLSGTGSEWDQKNYLSGRAGWEFSPYYSLPAVLTNYQHREVLRNCLGGAFGIQGVFMNPAKKDEVFKQYFETTLSSNWNLNRLSFIATIQGNESSNREVLNAVYGVVGTPEAPDMSITALSDEVAVVNSGVTHTTTYELSNETDSEKTFEVFVSKSPRTPEDWSASVSLKSGGIIKKNDGIQSLEITLNASEKAEFDLNLTPSTTIGKGDALIEVATKGESNGMKRAAKVTVYSKEIEFFYVNNPGQASYAITNYLPATDNYISFDIEEFSQHVPKFYTGMNTLVWDLGATESFTSDQINKIKTAMGYGANVFLLGNLTTSSLNSAQALPNFNLQFNNLSREGYGQAPYRIWLSGIENDPISGNLGNSFEGNLINYLLYMFKISNYTKAFPILRFRDSQIAYNSQGQQIGTVQPEDALLGARILTNYDSRAVILGLTPSVIVDANKRKTLLDNIFIWLKGETDVEENITLPTNLTLTANPNPIEVSSSINFSTPEARNIKISLFNQLGQEVTKIFEGNVDAGSYSTNFEVSSLSSGSYYIVLKSGTEIISQPVSIVK